VTPRPRLHGKARRSCATCLHGLIVVLLAMRLGGEVVPLFAAQAPAMPAPTVIAEVTARTVPIYDEFVARTLASQTVEMRARVKGFLERVRFQEGSLDKEGQPLFVVEQPPYEAVLQSAKAPLATAQADLTPAQEQVDVLRAKA
jgi:multidrug efflux pump subunit AcrA (membrane-fusion protein)